MKGEERISADSTHSLPHSVDLCFNCVYAPTTFLFSLSPQGQSKGGAAAADLRASERPADCLIPNRSPEERRSNDHNDDERCSEMLTGGFLDKGQKVQFSARL